MQIDNSSHNTQAKTIARPCTALLQPVKTLKNFLALCFGNAWAVIGNNLFNPVIKGA